MSNGGATDNPGLIMPPPLMLLIALLLAAGLDIVLPIAVLPAPGLGNALGWLGAIIALAALAMEAWAVMTFRAAHTNPEPWKPTLTIVNTGPYRFTRNPMYIGMTALQLGLSLVFSLEWGVVLTPLLWLAYDRLVVAREEAYLTRKFGASYQALLEQTRRWL
jgi:protein-S-isoprenylcysteine O-methyltransferase Ste14